MSSPSDHSLPSLPALSKHTHAVWVPPGCSRAPRGHLHASSRQTQRKEQLREVTTAPAPRLQGLSPVYVFQGPVLGARSPQEGPCGEARTAFWPRGQAGGRGSQRNTAARLPICPPGYGSGATLCGDSGFDTMQEGAPRASGTGFTVYDLRRWLRANKEQAGGAVPRARGDEERVPVFWAWGLRARLPGVSLPQHRKHKSEAGERG